MKTTNPSLLKKWPTDESTMPADLTYQIAMIFAISGKKKNKEQNKLPSERKKTH